VTIPSDLPTYVQLPGNGSALTFNVPIKIFQATDLVVGFITSLGYVLQPTSSYTVSSIDVNGGCIVTFAIAPPSGTTVDFRTTTPKTQPTDFSNLGAYNPESTTEAADRLTRVVQDFYRVAYTFGLHGPDSESTPWPALPPPAQRLGAQLIFDPLQGLPALGVPNTQVISTAFLAGFLALTQSPGEITAGVIPSNLAYVPGDIRRYGAVGDGVHDDTTAIQSALNVGKAAGTTVYIPAPANVWLVTQSLDCTLSGASAANAGFIVKMETNIHFSLNSPAGSIFAQHTSHVFDCAGNNAIQFFDVCVSTSQVTIPQTCFFLARNQAGASQIHRFIRCRVFGMFSVDVYYNYGSEDDVLDNCVFYNYANLPNTKVAIWTGYNVFGLSSPHITIATGGQSCRDHLVLGGQFANAAGSATTDVFYAEATNYLRLIGPWAACGSALAGGRAIMVVDVTNLPSSGFLLTGIEVENVGGGAQQGYGVYVGIGAGSSDLVNWKIDNCHLNSAIQAIYTAPAVVMDGWEISGVDTPVGGIQVVGTCKYSQLRNGALPLIIGSSQNNLLAGVPTSWTITARLGDYWIDQRTPTQRQFTPVLGAAFTNATAPAASTRNDCDGAHLDFELTLVPVTGQNQSCTAQATITGLPFTPTGQGECQVTDLTTNANLGTGYANAAAIYLPAITATPHNVGVRGRVRIG